MFSKNRLRVDFETQNLETPNIVAYNDYFLIRRLSGIIHNFQHNITPARFYIFFSSMQSNKKDTFESNETPFNLVSSFEPCGDQPGAIRRITENLEARDKFFTQLDSAILMHNASTQFADGGEFGMGAEIGIATGKLHARGPVGTVQLTSFKYLVEGQGTIRN